MSRIVIHEARCKGCGLCTAVCPQKLVGMSKQLNSQGCSVAVCSDPDAKCSGCAFCAMSCPDLAITVFKAD